MIARGLLAAALLFAACRTTGRAPGVAEPASMRPKTTALAGTNGDVVATGLAAVEMRLSRGDLELALVDLLDLARRHPDDPRVRTRLARVLHQRALVRYGHGSLDAAIRDWQRVVELEPGNACAVDLLATARAESARRPLPAK